MFSEQFYPTPPHVIEMMVGGLVLAGKVVCDPEAGKGDIVDYCLNMGASVIACELNADLRKILHHKCPVIGDDFLKVQSHQVSHVDYFIMNPPFFYAAEHILHAFNIAPDGCEIIALCNYSTIKNASVASGNKETLCSLIAAHGNSQNLGKVFANAERTTLETEIGLVYLKKPGTGYETEFEGFLLEEEPQDAGSIGIMPYNIVRDLVNRYVAAVKIFDEQLDSAVKMNKLTSGFYSSEFGFTCTEAGKPMRRNEFKKDLQKSAWTYIFQKLNMAKYATKGLKEDINKFVEKQNHIPFTMANIYNMLEIVIGTQGARMDKALLEVFDKLTQHHSDNRFHVEGWKTNSHYLIGQKFILPGMCSYSTGSRIEPCFETEYNNVTVIEDFLKALCYLTGDNYDNFETLYNTVRYACRMKYKGTDNYVMSRYGKPEADYSKEQLVRSLYKHKLKEEDVDIVEQRLEYGTWFDWSYFRVKAFKKGTYHFEFKDLDLWAKLNQHISRIKGYPLFEHKTQTDWQKKQNRKSAA